MGKSKLITLGILALTLIAGTPRGAWAQAQAAPATDYSLVGASIRTEPAHDGSAAQRLTVVPVLRVYRHGWFLRTTQGMLEAGPRVDLGGGLSVGGQVAYEAGRPVKDSAWLRQLGAPELGRRASLGAHLEWDGAFGRMPINALGRYRYVLGAGHQADARVTAGVYGSGRVLAGVFAQASWADAGAAKAYYGLPAREAADAGLSPFVPRGGVLGTSVGALGSVALNQRWTIAWSVEGRRLAGDAARSPLVERRWNLYATTGLALRF